MKRFICAQTRCPEDKHKCTFDEYDCSLYVRSIEIVNKPTNKYQAQKCEFNGEKFDSKRELCRWLELRLLERSGEISDLRRQVKFELIPTLREPDTFGKRGGVIKGKVIEHGVSYVADFVYRDKQGNTVVEDTKGVCTKEYVIKRKLMLYFHGIRIKEI